MFIETLELGLYYLNMDPTKAALFAVILEYALLEIKIVEGCSKLRKTVFPRKWPMSLDAAAALRSERAKLESDRNIVLQVLLATIIDISEKGEWEQLNKAIHDLTQDSVALQTARIDHDYLKKSLELLTKELKTRKKENKRDLSKAEDRITKLKDQTQV